VVLALVCAGYGLAEDRAISVKVRCLLAGVGLIAALLSRMCYHAYRGFTWEFAKAVYRDFATYEKPRGDEKSKAE